MVHPLYNVQQYLVSQTIYKTIIFLVIYQMLVLFMIHKKSNHQFHVVMIVRLNILSLLLILVHNHFMSNQPLTFHQVQIQLQFHILIVIHQILATLLITKRFVFHIEHNNQNEIIQPTTQENKIM